MKGLILLEKSYYDILEINKNASPEILEKAYKTLIKKYHPDLKENKLKPIYEEKIKKINEAYEILSDPNKRKNYDLTQKNKEISIEDYNILYNENINLKRELNTIKNNYNITYNENNYINNFKNFNSRTSDSINKTYYNEYAKNSKNQ